jgi:nitrate reductase NapAB chaperone NapD
MMAVIEAIRAMQGVLSADLIYHKFEKFDDQYKECNE